MKNIFFLFSFIMFFCAASAQENVPTWSGQKNDKPAQQAPLLIIKKDPAVIQTKQGWAKGTENADVTLKIPGSVGNVEVPGGGYQRPSQTLIIKQNPTGKNAKNNASALTQPPTIMISVPVCTGGQVLQGGTCGCVAPQVLTGGVCTVPTPCVAPPNTNSNELCSAYFNDPSWTGNVIRSTTWSCPTLYGSPISANGLDTSGCIKQQICNNVKPPDSVEYLTCTQAGYGGPGVTGNVKFINTYSCPNIYGPPAQTFVVDNSACTSTPSCVAQGSGTESAACDAPLNGQKTRNFSDNSCTGRSYTGWDTSGCSATACQNTGTGNEQAACDAGQSGFKSRTWTDNTCSGRSYSAWNTAGCSTNSCADYANGTESAACDSPYNGTKYRAYTDNNCNGRSYGPWDTNSCVIGNACGTTGTGIENAVCDGGASGSKTRTWSDNNCYGRTYGAWDSSQCLSAGSGAGSCTDLGAGIDVAVCDDPLSGFKRRRWTNNSCAGFNYGPWDTSDCKQPQRCDQRVVTTMQACPAPQSGQLTLRETVDCNGNITASNQDTSSCVAPLTCPGPKMIDITLWPNGAQKSFTQLEFALALDGKSCLTVTNEKYTCNQAGSCSVSGGL